MIRKMKSGVLVLFITLFLLLVSCAEIPKEVVELSYQVGRDMAALHTSYDKLVHERFEDFRQRRLNYLEERWKPAFLKRWVRKGKLIEVAKGELVWSDEAGNFIAPTVTQAEVQLLNTIDSWANEAVRKIEEKKKELLGPLDEQEISLRNDIKRAFDQVIKANAHITANLNSIREVQKIQDEALEALKLKELRDKLDLAMTKMSQQAESGLDSIKKADGFVSKVSSKL